MTTLWVALHTTEYETKAYLFPFSYTGQQPPEGQELADLLNANGQKVEFRSAFDEKLTAVYVQNPEIKP